MTRGLRIAVLAAFTAFATVTGIAHAEPSGTSTSAVDEGRSRFAKGVSLFRASDYRAALVEFNRAYAVAPSFRIQFNIGQTCAELQDYACASKAFSKFLADGGRQVPPAQRATAESEIKRLRSLVANVRVIVNVEGAEVAVDDARVGMSPLSEPVMVSAGRRKISAAKPPLAPVSSVVDVAGGDTIEIKLDLVEAGPSSLPPPPPPPPHPPDPPSRTPFWIGVTVAGVLTAATVTFGVLSLKAKSDLDATVGRFGVPADDVDRARSKVDTLALVTDLFGGAALVAGGITTYLFFTSKPSAPPSSSSQLGLGPGRVTFLHTF